MMGRWLAGAILALGLVAAAPAAAQYEPNDGIGQATGPLLGGTDYGGAIETSNDEDWFYFYTAGQAQLDVAVTSFGMGDVLFSLLDTDGNSIDAERASGNTSHITYSAAGAARYYVRTEGHQGETYQLRIDPADALTSTPPPLPTTPAPGSGERSPARSRPCRTARRVKRHAKRRLIRTRARLRRAERPVVRRRVRRATIKRRRALRRANQRVRRACR